MPIRYLRRVLTARAARQGYLDPQVLVVLTASLALAFVVLGALWLTAFGT